MTTAERLQAEFGKRVIDYRIGRVIDILQSCTAHDEWEGVRDHAIWNLQSWEHGFAEAVHLQMQIEIEKRKQGRV